jgi:type VI secretion system protein ImpL
MPYLVTALVLLIYLVLVWFLGRWLPLHGSDVWILRGVLAFLGLVGAGVAFWYQYQVKKAKEKEAAGDDDSQPGAADDVDALVREAVRRLKHSTLGRGTNLGSLPLVYVLGDSGSTKTTVLIHSALDPELLAGHVYRDNDILPTSTANIWYTRQAIFVDPTGAMMGQADQWRRLVKLLQPGRFSAALGKRAQAPRAAIVCFDCESFLQPGASETAVSAARRLSVRLQEVSQLLGISFPVYVLFTKLDRISFFSDFVCGMSKDEASEVLGATLPLRSLSAGVYADEETRRLTKAFDEIFYSLAERRIVLLPREHEGDKLPGIYEFPRELRKLRTLLVQFLVDLAHPSHLGTNPFLRGFYFTGVRPVVVDDVVAAPAASMEAAEAEPGGGATQIFRGVGSHVQQAPVAMRSGGSRRVPQWVFLTSLFNDVLAKDRVALATSGSSSHVNLLRRIALGTAVFVALLCVTGFAVSFLRNRLLETRVQEAVTDLSTLDTGTNQVAGLGDLKKLDNLRSELVDLSDYEENGPPLSLRWGLYEGNQIYPDAKRVYFERFRRLLFAETQKRVTGNLQALAGKSATNAPNDSYQKSYDELKAYLMTTDAADHGYSTQAFLTPVLMSHWVADREIGQDRKDLAALQFDFFATELAKENPFPTGNSKDLIDQARAYLRQFSGIDRNYAQLLSKATQKDGSFNDQYADSVGIIVSSHKVKGAFTRGGFLLVQDALKNPANYMGGEPWVVGKDQLKDMDPDAMRQKLADRYNQDFVTEWNTVLSTSSVSSYASKADADKKLEKLTGPTSPLLELLYFISHNTDPASTASADVKTHFAPVQTVEPPGPADKLPDHYIVPSNKEYIEALGKLQSDIHALAQSPGAPDPVQLTQAGNSADAASQAATKTVDSGPVDQLTKNQDQVRRLLQQPITYVEAVLRQVPGEIANTGGKSYCSVFNPVAKKYPFDPSSTQDLTMDQLYAVLGPTSDALKNLKDSVKPFAVMVGSKYVPNPSATVKPSANFLNFLSHVVALSDTLYPTGSLPPKFSYTLKQLPSNLAGVEMKIGSEKLAGDGAQKTFVWTGVPEDVQVTTKSGDVLDSFPADPWAAFKLVARARQMGGGKLEWVNENNGKAIMLANGKPKSYDYQLQVSGNANPFFDLQGMKCVSQVAGH